MKRTLIIFMLMLVGFSAIGQESKSYQFSLEDCLRFAFANSYERKSMELSGKSLEAERLGGTEHQ